MNVYERGAMAALATLVILQIVMLTALFTQTQPHPPVATPLFGIAPFLAASFSAAVASAILGPTSTGAGQGIAILAGFCALVSFGPQKFFDAQFGLIWPAVVGAQLAVVGLIVSIVRSDAPERQT